MAKYAAALEKLVEELQKLPGIGPKSAQRLAFHLLKGSEADARALAEAILKVKSDIHFCARCFNFSEEAECGICTDERRDQGLICVVEEPNDLMALERAGTYHGVYHVLHGRLSPLEGITEDEIRIGELVARVTEEQPREVILATSPTVEGDATANYIAALLEPSGVDVTMIAVGLPVGGDLDYADQVTIARALQGRTKWRR